MKICTEYGIQIKKMRKKLSLKNMVNVYVCKSKREKKKRKEREREREYVCVSEEEKKIKLCRSKKGKQK